MKVALRDDDACYFTAPETLERMYRDVWDQVPVCLATVPFAIGYERSGIPREHWTSGESFALERNQPLVGLLKDLVSRGRATIALHGYTHQDYPDGYEFQAAPDPERRVRHGLDYLHATLGTRPSIFVPPHNALSKRGLTAVSEASLDLLGSFLSFRPSMRPWDGATLANWWRVRRFRAATGRGRADRFVYPYVLRYRRHAEFGCHSLVPATTLEQLIGGFEEARALGGDFCLATHYWEIDARMKDIMRRFLDHAAAAPGVRFVRAEDLFSG
jgi:predicted deacetylase